LSIHSKSEAPGPRAAPWRHSRRARAFSRAMLLALLAWVAPPAAWGITDEIQVYTDDINKPGDFGLELHVNTTPSGRGTPAYPGDVPPLHSLRVTPEFSYGITRDFEAGFYLPGGRDRDGNWFVSGAKLRLKWLPLQPDEEKGGWYAGANLELSSLDEKYSESRYSSELRTIFGYRAPQWLIGVNPIFEWNLSPGFRYGGPEFTLAVKAMHDVRPGIALGMEYYDSIGRITDTLPHGEQEQTLYFAIDVDRKPWVFNAGIGRGLTGATDRWTLKAIFEIPF
jgi:hypothetical protein